MAIRTHHALPESPVPDLDAYVDAGGLTGLAAARDAGADATIDAIGRAGVRGRGGAGFPTAKKWRGVLDGATDVDRIDVVVNAAEGEPGTFKDRALLRANPYLVLEGALIAATTMGASRIVIATKASYTPEIERIERAVDELAGRPVDVEIVLVRGPDHYLFGEETALLQVVEGDEPLPRHIPPYLYGLFSTAPQLGWSSGEGADIGSELRLGSHPALVNNVETYAHVALVLRNGADWYRGLGTDDSPGPTIVTITGDVQYPAVAEVELGHPLADVIAEVAGGPHPGRTIKGVLSGVSNPVLTGDRLDTPVTYEDLAAAGGGLGSAGFMVYDDSRNMVDVAFQVARFLHVESCGQCNPCKTGTQHIAVALEQLVLDGGLSDRASGAMERALQTVTDASRCYLPTQAQRLIPSVLEAYPDDLEARITGRPGDPEVVLPKLVELADGVATVDEAMLRKRSDWTYAETPVRLGPAASRSGD